MSTPLSNLRSLAIRASCNGMGNRVRLCPVRLPHIGAFSLVGGFVAMVLLYEVELKSRKVNTPFLNGEEENTFYTQFHTSMYAAFISVQATLRRFIVCLSCLLLLVAIFHFGPWSVLGLCCYVCCLFSTWHDLLIVCTLHSVLLHS